MGPSPRRTFLPLDAPPLATGRLRSVTGAIPLDVAAGDRFLHRCRGEQLLFVVERGAVAVGAPAASGRAAVTDVLGAGEALFAERRTVRAVDDAGPAAFDAVALVPSRVVAVERSALALAVVGVPDLGSAIVALVADREARLRIRLAETLTLPLPERLLTVLRDLAARFPDRAALPSAFAPIALPLTQELLAGMAGAARESTNRALRALVRRGLVVKSGRRYSVTVGSSS